MTAAKVLACLDDTEARWALHGDPVADAIAHLEEVNLGAAWALAEAWWDYPEQAVADLERWPVL